MKLLSASLIIFSPIFSLAPAHAQLQYGQWTRIRDCRTITVKRPLGRSNIPIPIGKPEVTAWNANGAVRYGMSPSLRDKLSHPVKCFTKREISGYSEFQSGANSR